jgi:hypothetical protein
MDTRTPDEIRLEAEARAKDKHGIGNGREHFFSVRRGQGMSDDEIQRRWDAEHGRG